MSTFVMLFAFVGLAIPFWRRREMIYVLIPIVICTAMTLATCAAQRYNFIFIPFILMFAAYALRYFYRRMQGATQ